MKSHIIHMTGTHSRSENVTRLVSCLPNASVINAVDGRDPQQASEIPTVAGTLHDPAYPFPLTPGEVGCFLSHRRCWDIIARDTAPYALVVEDDLVIDPQLFETALWLAEKHADENSFIRFPTTPSEQAAEVSANQNGSVLSLPRIIGLQTICQLIGRSTAQLLLNATQTIDRPVDTLLQMHWVTGQQVHSVFPNGVSELNQGTTVQQKARLNTKLRRAVLRMRYRRQIKMRPQGAW